MGLQCSVKSSFILFIIVFSVTQASCSVAKLNCSRPDQLELLNALTPVFKLKAIRPVVNISTQTNVTAYFFLYGILGVDEKTQILMTYIWLNYEWHNEFVSWDPAQCGADKISLPREKLWVPDIVISEFMDENTAPDIPYVFVDYNGTVYDSYPVRVVSSCNLDINTFPFDIQNCSFSFFSYIYSDSELTMKIGLSIEEINQISNDIMTTIGEWQLLNIEHVNFGYELVFHIKIRRRPMFYVVNLLIPSCFLVTVDLFSFLLPPQSTDRSSFKMTLILGYTVFLLIMNDLLPVTGDTIPLLNVFFSLCLGLMVGSLLETLIITNLLCGTNKFSPVPRWVRVLVLQFVGCLLGLCITERPNHNNNTAGNVKAGGNACPLVVKESTAGEKGSELEEKTLEELRRLGRDLHVIRLKVDQELTGSQNNEDWIQVGFIIDRLLFALYAVFLIASFITIITIMVISYTH